MTRNENKPHFRSQFMWKCIFSHLGRNKMFLSSSARHVVFLTTFLLCSRLSNAESHVDRRNTHYITKIIDNHYDENKVIYQQHQPYTQDVQSSNNQRSFGVMDNEYAALAAISGLSVLAVGISLNMFANSDSGDMMKSLISPFGFGRTSQTTDVASNIPNLEAAEGSYEGDQGPIERIVDIADSWSRAIGMNECGQAAICEAHANNRDYGLIALPILFFFPGSRNSNGNPASVWQEAALRGKARDSCSSRYSCIVNPMWIVKFLMTTLVY